MRWPALWLLIRPSRDRGAALLLPVVTFAVLIAGSSPPGSWCGSSGWWKRRRSGSTGCSR